MVLDERSQLEASLHCRCLGLGEPVTAVAERSPEVPHRLRVRDERGCELLVLLLREPRGVEQLAKRSLAHLVGLAQDVLGSVRLQAPNLVADPTPRPLSDQAVLHRMLERLRLDLGGERGDQHPDPVDQRVDERETLGRLEQRARQRGWDALAQERVEDRRRDLVLRLEPRREDDPDDVFLAPSGVLGEKGDVVVLVGLHHVDERKTLELRLDLALQRRVLRGVPRLRLEIELQVRRRFGHERLERDPPPARPRSDNDQQLSGMVLGRLERDPIPPVFVGATLRKSAPVAHELLPDGDRGVRELTTVLICDRAVDPVPLLIHLPLLSHGLPPHRKRGAGDSAAADSCARCSLGPLPTISRCCFRVNGDVTCDTVSSHEPHHLGLSRAMVAE